MAAGMWDRMLAFLGFEEEPEEAEVEEAPIAAAVGTGSRGYVRHEAPPLPERRARRVQRPAAPEERAEVRGYTRSGNITHLVQGLPGLVVEAPRRFEDAQEAADHLKAGRPVILHLEGLDREVGQRIVNFLMGAAYALGGAMHRVGAIILFAPAGVEVSIPLSLRLSDRDGKPTGG